MLNERQDHILEQLKRVGSVQVDTWQRYLT